MLLVRRTAEDGSVWRRGDVMGETLPRRIEPVRELPLRLTVVVVEVEASPSITCFEGRKASSRESRGGADDCISSVRDRRYPG